MGITTLKLLGDNNPKIVRDYNLYCLEITIPKLLRDYNLIVQIAMYATMTTTQRSSASISQNGCKNEDFDNFVSPLGSTVRCALVAHDITVMGNSVGSNTSENILCKSQWVDHNHSSAQADNFSKVETYLNMSTPKTKMPMSISSKDKVHNFALSSVKERKDQNLSSVSQTGNFSTLNANAEEFIPFSFVQFNDEILDDIDDAAELADIESLDVPVYTGQSMREMFREVSIGTSVKDLARVGWPKPMLVAYTAKRNRLVMDAMKRGEEATLKIDEEKHVRFKQFDERIVIKNTALGCNVWVVKENPRIPSSSVVKPMFYTKRSFQSWVQTVRRLTQFKKKTQYFTGNFAAQTLYEGDVSQLKYKQVTELFQKASIFMSDYHVSANSNYDLGAQPLSKLIQTDTYEVKSFFIHGQVFVNPRELELYSLKFPKNRNLFKHAIAGLRGDPNIDFDKVQNNLTRYVLEPVEIGCTPSDFIHGIEEPVELQGGFLSKAVTVKVEHEIKFKLPTPRERNDALHALYDDIQEAVGENATRLFIKVIALVIGVTTSNSLANVVAQLTGFCAGNTYLWNCLMKLQGKFHEPQGVGELFSKMGSEFGSYVSQLMTFIGIDVLLTGLFSVNGVLATMITEAVLATRTSIKKMAADGLALVIISYIKTGFTLVKDCIQTRSLAPLWGKRWNPSHFTRLVQALEAYETTFVSHGVYDQKILQTMEKLRETGQCPEEWLTPVSPGVFRDYCEEQLIRGNELLEHFQSSPSIVIPLRSVFNKFDSYVAILRLQTSCISSRIVPYALLFVGSPGVGKTTINQVLAKSISNRFGFSLGTDGLFIFEDANFADGLRGSHWFWIFDDIDHNTIAPGQPTPSTRIIKSVNSTIYPIEQADITNKGKHFGHPLMVVHASNFENGRHKDYTPIPAAPYRRYKHKVHVTVKPEYADAYKRLDVEKADAATTVDMFTFRVSEFQDEDKWSAPRTMTFPEFLEMVSFEFDVHLKREINRLSKLQAGSKGELCKRCYLGTDQCGCKKKEEPVVKVTSCSSNFKHEANGSTFYSDGERWHELSTDPFGAYFYMKDGVPIELEEKNEDDVEVDDVEFQMMTTDQRLPKAEDKYFKFFGTREDIHDLEQENKNIFTSSILMMRFFFISSVMLGYTFWQSVYFYFLIDNAVGAVAFNEQLQTRVAQGCTKFEEEQLRSLRNGSIGIFAVVAVLGLGCSYVTMQSREGNATGKVPATWFRTEEKNFEPRPAVEGWKGVTWTKEDATKAVHQSFCNIRGPRGELGGVVLTNQVIVVPTHVANIGETIVIDQNGRKIEVVLTKYNTRILASQPELMAVKSEQLYSCVGIYGKLMAARDSALVTTDETELHGHQKYHENFISTLKTYHGSYVLTAPIVTIKGDCGKIYVTRVNNSWFVLGMHFGLKTGLLAQETLAGLLFRNEMEKVIEDLNVIPQMTTFVKSAFSKDPTKEITFDKLDARSEIWAAQTNYPGLQLHVLGKMNPPLVGMTLKSKVKRSITASYFADFEKKVCGRTPYWVVPNFGGNLDEENQWHDPFTKSFETFNECKRNEELIAVAVCDYLSGMEFLTHEGYRPLTKFEVIRGVPGSTIGPMNLKTSTGPPLGTSKKNHIICGENELFISPELTQISEETRQIFDRGEIPRLPIVATMKDESKALDDKTSKPKVTRIFNNPAFAMNEIMREHISPITTFVRDHSDFFEGMVGMDLTSSEINNLVNSLREISPDLTKIYDGDVSKMDKSWAYWFHEVVLVICYTIAKLIMPEYKNEVRRTVEMERNSVIIMKQDVFASPQHTSGIIPTVEFNGFMISITERMVWYLSNPFKGDLEAVMKWWTTSMTNSSFPPIDPHYSYRKNNKLLTYGDDNLVARRNPPADDFYEHYRQVSGLIMKSADKKEGKPIPRRLDETEFCKRRMVYQDVVGMYVGQLSKKSMARMVCIKNDSTLSERDSAAVGMTEALREMVHYGKEEYDEFLSKCNEVAVTLGLCSNPYYKVKTYEEHLAEMREGKFRSWHVREDPHFEVVKTEEQKFVYQMEANNLVESSNLNLENTPVTPAPTTGAIIAMAEGNTVGSELPEVPLPLTKLPAVSMDEKLCRPVKLFTLSLTAADVVGSFLSNAFPIGQYLATPMVTDVTKGVTYIRGDFQLMFVFSAPPNALGGYTFAAYPQGEAVGAAMATPSWPVMAQMDHFAIYDAAMPQSIVFQLPFLHPHPYACVRSVDGLTMEQSWKNLIACERPMANLFGGVATGQVTCYGSFLPGYELAGLTYQMNELEEAEEGVLEYQMHKHKALKANDALKQLAPDAHPSNEKHVGVASAMAGSVAKAAGMLSMVPMLAPFTAPIGEIAGVAQSVLSAFGFTRKSTPETFRRVISTLNTNYANCDGEDAGLKSALAEGNALEDIFGGEDCTAIASLTERPTLIRQLTWNCSDAVDTSLGVIPVTPMYTNMCPENDQLPLPVAGYIGLAFKYISFDATYRIKVFRSICHRGTVCLIYQPLSLTPTGDTTGNSQCIMLDIAEDSEFIVHVAWCREKGCVQTRLITNGIAVPIYVDCNGSLQFKVVNPLVSTASASPYVTINVYASFSNVEYGVLADHFTYTNTAVSALVNMNFMSSIVLQQSEMQEAEEGNVEYQVKEYTLVQNSTRINGAAAFFGETITSVRALMQKPVVYGTTTTSLNGSVLLPMYLNPPNPATATETMTYGIYFRSMFHGMAGSEKIRVTYGNANTVVGATRYVPNTLAVSNALCLNNQLCAGSFVRELVIPYYLPVKYVHCRNQYTLAAGDYLTKVEAHTFNAADSAIGVRFEHSLGQDIRFTMFRFCPLVKLRDAQTYTYPV